MRKKKQEMIKAEQRQDEMYKRFLREANELVIASRKAALKAELEAKKAKESYLSVQLILEGLRREGASS